MSLQTLGFDLTYHYGFLPQFYTNYINMQKPREVVILETIDLKENSAFKLFLDSVPLDDDFNNIERRLREFDLTLVRVSAMRPKTYLVQNKMYSTKHLTTGQKFEPIVINDQPTAFLKDQSRQT